jgi:hypothetical protein
MATEHDLHRAQADRAAWSFDPDAVQPEQRKPISRKSSAARITAEVREGLKAHAKDRDEVLERLQAKRKRRKAERAKIAGLTTAEILAARRLGTG